MADQLEKNKEFTLPYEWAELVSKLQRGDCVLFFGSEAPYGYDKRLAPPSASEMAQELAKASEYKKANYSLPEVAQFYQSRFKPQSLIDRVRTLSEGKPKYRPGKIQQLIAQLPFPAIITTRYDTLLEQALDDARKPYEVIISSPQVSYIGSDKLLLLKLYGCRTRPESLVITKRDQFALQRRLEAVLNVVRYLFVTKHLLFVDYNFEDPAFQFLFNEVFQSVGPHQRRAYVVLPEQSADLVALWPDVNLTTTEADSIPFLEELERNFKSQPIPKLVIEHPSPPINKPPYKFLDYYTQSDRDIFYGRDNEILFFWRRILSHPLTTLFGPSGAGKTSLFLAGVAPELNEQGYHITVVRPLGDPLNAIKLAAAKLALGPVDADQSLPRLFAALPTGKAVIALDQFEEVFLTVGQEAREQFYKEIAEVTANPDLDIRFVLMLREDFLPYLDEAKKYLPRIFTDSYRITNLSREQAQQAIVEPARQVQLLVEAELVEKLLLDLEEMGIAPPQLQIICHQLYTDCLKRNEAKNEQGVVGESLTLARYMELGGIALLGDYLDDVLSDIEKIEGLLERTAAQEVLKVMVSSQQTKLAMTFSEVEQGCQARRMSRQAVESALRVLVNRRLIRQFERRGITYFELAHDYLGQRVAKWISEEEWAAKRASEMVRREMANWQELQSLISEDRFRVIDGVRDDLLHIEKDEAELLARSAFEYGISEDYWLDKAHESGWDTWVLIDEILKHENPFVRARAVAQMGRQEPKKAITVLRKQLTDGHPRVREEAVEQLELLEARDAISDLINLLKDTYPSVANRTAKALYKIGTYDAIMALENYRPNNMILVPAGKCLVGSTEEDIKQHIEATGEELFKNELPQHEVYLDDYLIDKYLVTNLEYKKFVEATNYPPPANWLNGEIPPGTENYPVSMVSWSDANNYATWAGKRLPNEYEWEKAASWDPVKNVKYHYPWGNKFDASKCHVNVHAGREPYEEVGAYSPSGDSPYKLADAIGNGWVWVDGIFSPYPGSDYKDAYYGKNMRIQRSCGGWDNDTSHCYHVTHRVGMPDAPNAEVTFRCAMTIHEYLIAFRKDKQERISPVSDEAEQADRQPSDKDLGVDKTIEPDNKEKEGS